MVRLVPIRDGGVPETLIVLREGVQTLDDVVLAQACERALGEIGVPGFSVLELPGGDFDALARLRPLLRVRRKVFIASGASLVGEGLALIPTFEFPHWTVVVPDPSPAAFALARTLFRGPIDNPAYEGRRP